MKRYQPAVQPGPATEVGERDAKRKSWRTRECLCGQPVQTRWQIEITVCRSTACMDAAFLKLGYVPTEESVERRASFATAATESGEPVV